MIRLATVFSGIGAIEHALERMNIDTEIVFACDNGDVDVLSKKIDIDMDQISTELKSLKGYIDEIEFSDDDYENQLIDMFNSAEKEYVNVKDSLYSVNIDNYENLVITVLNTILAMEDLSKNRIKIFNGFKDALNEKPSLTQKKLFLYRIILKIINDFKRDNSLDNLGNDDFEFQSSINVDWDVINKPLKTLYDQMELDEGRKLIRNVQNLSQRVGQLYAKINSLHHLNELKKIDSYSEKKEYVDNLYRDYESKNKVKISYMANYDCSEETFHWDATFLDGTQYRDKVDLFVGGSPCQSFSLVGKHRGLSDTRGTLFYEYARLVKEIQPKVFIYENVKAVLSNDCGRTWEKMKEVFQDLGYNVYYENNGKPSILNAKDYGIPQNRERLFVVGFRSDLKLEKEFSFPTPIPLEKKMKDFLMDDAPGKYFLSKKGVAFVTKEKNLKKMFTQIDGDIALCQKKNQEFNWHGDFVFQSEIEAINNDIENLDKYLSAQPVEKIALNNGTKRFITNNFNSEYTKGRIRKLTPRECLRLMGFRDDFKIAVSDTAMYQQSGNSIVVDVLIYIMKQTLEVFPKLI